MHSRPMAVAYRVPSGSCQPYLSLDNTSLLMLQCGLVFLGGLMALRVERILHREDAAGTDFPGIELCPYASSACGARNFYTGLATFQPGAKLPLHTHTVSEAITVLDGQALVQAGDREYRLHPFDCVHIPAGLAHGVLNDSSDAILLTHSSFAEPSPTRTLVPATDIQQADRQIDPPANPASPELAPESLRRFEAIETYALAEGTVFRDLFARRFGAVGICGGHGRFLPGSSLPCHVHRYDESITIVGGQALCQVEGAEYTLGDYDTAFIPEGRAHRFLNVSDQPMVMIWVYAGDEPDRALVDLHRCSHSKATSSF